MFELFTKKIETNNGVATNANLSYLKNTYLRNLLKLTNYYNNKPFFVDSNHLLCRLLITATVPVTYTLDRYMEAAYVRSPYVAKLFNFTSPINYGKIFDGVFYGQGNKEIIIYNEEYFNPFEWQNKWKEIKAIKVLKHNISDFNMLLPDGDKNSSGEGYCFITIDIPKLLFQYRGFQLEQSNFILDKESNNEDNAFLSVANFVHMYVLPSMLSSHLNYILVNRLKALFYGEPFTEAKKQNVFYTTTYADKIDFVLKDIVKRMKNNNLRYEVVLKNIPSFFDEDQQESLLMPVIAPTRQVWWATFLSRLDIVQLLIDLEGPEGIQANSFHILKLKTTIKRLLDQNIYKGILDSDDAYDVNRTLINMMKL